MAAPSLDVDWEAVKAHALVFGVRPAARAFGIDENTVCQRSAREGWMKPQEVQRIEPATMRKKIVSKVIKPSEAARSALSKIGNKSKLYLSKAVLKGAKVAAKLDGLSILDRAPQVKALADTGDKLHQWTDQPAIPTLRLELIANAVAEELPAIDVESDVLPVPSPELDEG